MKIDINLASEPFRKDRPMLVASVVVGVLQVALLILLINLATNEKGQMKEIRAEQAQLTAQVERLAAEQASLEGVLRRPENAEVLERTLFLNLLLYRKGISWTRVFGDLQQVMPHNVRLISVRPQVDGENNVVLEMVVGSESGSAVIDMLKRLEGSALFGNAAVHNSLPPSQTDPLFRYRISVSYMQKL
jgi:Tfp pilus assembly protein PilN